MRLRVKNTVTTLTKRLLPAAPYSLEALAVSRSVSVSQILGARKGVAIVEGFELVEGREERERNI